MSETPDLSQSNDSVPGTAPPRPRRARTGRKRTVFQVPPRPAPAVRDLWGQASEEERTRAHLTCTLMLEYWLGKKSKAEVGKELGVPALRVWQLSQQAVSGMLAGLLKQPRRRRTAAEIAALCPEDDPVLLRKEIRELQTKLARTEDLVRVLRTAPWISKQMESPAEEKRRARNKQAKRRPARRRNQTTRRSAPSEPSARPSRDGDAGANARSD